MEEVDRGGEDIYWNSGEAKVDSRMKFQVCEVQKALAAVWRIAANGNGVCFGPEEKDCFIQNVEDGREMMMRMKG